MKVKDYEYNNNNVEGKVSQERGQELIDKIQKVMKKDSVAHFEILKIGKNDEELEFLYNYLEENNITIRGIEITAEAIDGFERVSKQGVNYHNLPEAMDWDLQKKLFEQIEDIKEECKQNGTNFLKDEKYLEIKNKLWNGNLRLARYIAGFKSFEISNKSQDELSSYGFEAISDAIEKFDLKKGAKFSTYAWKAIYRRIERGIATEYGINQNLYIEFKEMKDTIEMFWDETGREPGMNELRDMLGFTEDKIKKLYNLDKIFVNFNSFESAVVGDDYVKDTVIDGIDDGEQVVDCGDVLYDGDSGEIVVVPETATDYNANTVDKIDCEFLKEKIEEALKTLTPREAEVIRLRFGLKDGSVALMEEVGNVFGVTRERIRQIEAKSLRKLRHPSRSEFFEDLKK